MGLLRDEPTAQSDAPDPTAESPAVLTETTCDTGLFDGWDDYGDRLLDAARDHAISRRRGRKRSSSDADLLGALERSITENHDLLDVMLGVAQRITPKVEAEDGPRLLGSVEPDELDAVLRRGSLWARLWRHVERQPIVPDLNERERRRFANLVAARGMSNTSITRGPLSEPVVRRAEDLIEAHAALSRAFGRVALTVDRRRAFAELNLSDNPMAYEVMLILFNARATRRTIAELRHLAANGELPALEWLRSPDFDAGWAIAVRIDPVAVPPFMDWCSGLGGRARAGHHGLPGVDA